MIPREGARDTVEGTARATARAAGAGFAAIGTVRGRSWMGWSEAGPAGLVVSDRPTMERERLEELLGFQGVRQVGEEKKAASPD